MKMTRLVGACALGVAVSAGSAVRAAQEEASPFDGSWEVTLTCPPHHEDDDAKGYVHRFPAVVKRRHRLPGRAFAAPPVAQAASV